MIHHECQQGGEEWCRLRLSIPTTSAFDRILTAKKLEPSTQRTKYKCQLLVEYLFGLPQDDETIHRQQSYQSAFMERGKSLEEKAAVAYEFENDVETTACGICILDDRLIGSSPDRFVGEDGLLEIKTASAETHLGYMLDDELLRDEYRLQTQGELWVTGREWLDLMSYNPALPSVKVRVEPDPKVFAAFAEHVVPFALEVQKWKLDLEQYRKLPRPKAVRDPDPWALNEYPEPNWTGVQK